MRIISCCEHSHCGACFANGASSVETVPKGFVKVEKTPGGRNADLNMDNKGRSCYLCYRRGHGIV